jgi:uncharacterized membrane protein YgcG
MNWPKQSLALVVSGSLVMATAQAARADEVEQSMVPPTVQAVQQSPEGLDQVVAPIALYPDTLIAQILAASAYPDEIVEADRWMQQGSGLDSEALAQAVDQQSWDPSVKALTQFPLVLANMDKNLSWTRALGNAYESDPQNVLNAVQVMRQRAQQAGNLMSTPQETVTTKGPTILIQPAEADTVYLPEYDPWLVYGAPIPAYPDWNEEPGLFVTEPEVLFGLGIGIGAFAAFGWGYHHWGADWHGRSVVYNHNTDFPRSRGFAGHDDFLGGHPTFAHGGFSGGAWRGPIGTRFGAYNGLSHGGAARTFAFHGGPGFGGGFHSFGGGFHGGGFHGGGIHGGGGGHR